MELVESQSFEDERQFATFWLGERLYGIDVMKVQEVTHPMKLTDVPLTSPFVIGLINLRGQISIAIDLRNLFQMETIDNLTHGMSVVSKINDQLFSFYVDRIGDVIQASAKDFEDSPETIDPSIKSFMGGVYKTADNILSIIDVEKVTKFIFES